MTIAPACEMTLRCKNCRYTMAISAVALRFLRFVQQMPKAENGLAYERCRRCNSLHEYELCHKLTHDRVA